MNKLTSINAIKKKFETYWYCKICGKEVLKCLNDLADELYLEKEYKHCKSEVQV